MKKFLNFILSVIIIILLIAFILFKLNIPVFGYRCFIVMSGSMESAISTNDLIIIKSSDKYNVGDIVTYKEENYYVTHRIVEINGSKVITKGDSNNVADSAIDISDIEGKYVGKIPGFNYYLSVIYSPVSLVFIFIIGLVITIFIKDNNNEDKVNNM